MINKNRIFLLVCLIFTVTIQAQNAVDLFISMPAELLPGITEANKTLLLVDTTETSVPFMFGEIRKVKQGDDFIKIETSNIGNMQLKLLPVTKDSSIVCVIKTVCGGVDTKLCDSDISFYTTEWKKLDSDTFLDEVSAEIFFDSSQKGSENYKYALSLPDIYPISAEFNENNDDLILIFNYKERISDIQIAGITPFLKSDSITLKWEDSSFR
ncbi:MAG: DUF3256 family protein [Bacteroidales bacterium]|nr:DUF3256 family protein [Bacteroidales bacterium]